MSKKLYTESYIQNIADAIREKNGLTRKYMVGEMALAISEIPTGSDLLALAAGSEIFDLDDATVPTDADNIPQYMFYSNQNVRDIALPTIESIGAYAFNACHNIRDINLPECVSIGDYAFYQARRSTYATSDTFNLPKCESIGQNAFYEFTINNANLVINLPECETLGNGSFRSTSLSYGVTAQEVNLPKIKTIGDRSFQRANITTFKIGSTATTLGTSVFTTATITNLYCYATTPPTVGTNLAGSDGTITHIYVPSASVAAYKAASGWNEFSSIIEAIP